MKKILVATDFSSTSIYSLKLAIEYAKVLKAQIFLVHAIERRSKAGSKMAYKQRLLEDVEDRLRQLLINKIGERADGVKITCRGVIGDMSAIHRAAQVNEVDLICMGTVGKTKKDGVSLGANSGMMLKWTSIPLLVVPRKAEVKIPETVLFNFRTLGKKGNQLLRPLKALLKVFKSHLLVNHVIVNDEDILTDEVEELIKGIKFEYSQSHEDTLFKGMKAFLKKTDVDLICMIRRNRGVFERLFTKNKFKKSMIEFNKPTLLLPEYI